jgi:hypothetical protein
MRPDAANAPASKPRPGSVGRPRRSPWDDEAAGDVAPPRPAETPASTAASRRQLINARIDRAIADLLQRDTQGITFYERSTDAPFGDCPDFVAGLDLLDTDLHAAEQCFVRAAENPSNGAEVRLAAHCNLVGLAQAQGQPTLSAAWRAYRFADRLPMPAAQRSREHLAEIYAAIMRDWDRLSTLERRDVQRRLPAQVADNDMFLTVTYPHFRTTILRDLDNAVDADARREMLQALERAKEAERVYRPADEDSDYFELLGFAHAAWRDVEVADWKRAPSTAGLDRLLEDMAANSSWYDKPTLPLRLLDLFEGTADADMKRRIVQAAFDREAELFGKRLERQPSAAAALAMFAQTQLCALHVESGRTASARLFRKVILRLEDVAGWPSADALQGSIRDKDDADLLAALAIEAVSLRDRLVGMRDILQLEGLEAEDAALRWLESGTV